MKAAIFISLSMAVLQRFSTLVNAFSTSLLQSTSIRSNEHIMQMRQPHRHGKIVVKLHESSTNDKDKSNNPSSNCGELERLKQEEQRLTALLTSIREEKLAVLRERPLNIGIVGFGRFGQFIAKSFTKYGNVVGVSRSDYTSLAEEMGAKYIPMNEMERFVVDEDLDVIVLAVSIVSFEKTVEELVPFLRRRMELKGDNSCPLIVDVLSVKEHPKNILLKFLPEECDILCSHPVRPIVLVSIYLFLFFS